MPKWTVFPQLGEFSHNVASVRKHWGRLHQGDAEPLPTDDALLAAWALFHNGEFEKAAEAGQRLGGRGLTVANKATCVYANYLEKKEKAKLDLFLEAAERAEQQAEADPKYVNAWFWKAYALGRYSQGISVARALAQGLGSQVKESLERVIQLEPHHADAHIALGTFHAEVIDKVGTLIGNMTYGAKKEVGLRLFQEGLRLHPHSAIAMVEYANGQVMLDGDRRMAEATRLYELAAASTPADAMERLDVELARAELDDD